MENIVFEDVKINYEIVRRGTKNLYARIGDNDVVRISVPYFITRKSIEKFVIESYFKLIKKRNKRKNNNSDNSRYKIFGNEYSFEDSNDINFVLTKKLKEYLNEEYLNICKFMNISSPPRVILKKVKGYLGQYNKKNHQITLNILIAQLDKECIKYVIIHELTHIKYMNHQKEFWDEVDKYLPNYKNIRNRCRKEFVYYENY